MSAGRRTRRQLKRGRIIEAIKAAAGERARYVGDLDTYEMWLRGPVLHLVPRIPLGAPEELAAAVSRRRMATITGTCDCGAAFRLHGSQLDMAHEHECPASDAGMAEVLERHGWTAHYIDGRTA